MTDSIGVTIQNASGENFYIAASGVGQRGEQYWLDFERGVWTDNGEVYNAEANYPGPALHVRMPVPPADTKIGSGRLYITDQRLTSPTQPSVTAPFNYTWVEFSFGKGAVWNTTNVDFFAVPIQLARPKYKETVGFQDSVNGPEIIKKLKGLPEPWGKAGGSQPFRFLAPMHALGALDGVLDKAITDGLASLHSFFKNNKGYTFTYGAVTILDVEYDAQSPYTLRIHAAGLGPETWYTLSGITTQNVLACTIPAGTGAQPLLAGLIASCINRGVIGNPKDWGTSVTHTHGNNPLPEEYYIPRSSNDDQYNKYAEVLHRYSLAAPSGTNDRLCYAFPYDDYFSMESIIPVPGTGNPNVQPGDELELKILPLVPTPAASGEITAAQRPAQVAV